MTTELICKLARRRLSLLPAILLLYACALPQPPAPVVPAAEPASATVPVRPSPPQPCAPMFPAPTLATPPCSGDHPRFVPLEGLAPEPSRYQDGAKQTRVTYYAKRFKGRRTTSGVRYDPELLTAASNDYPLGSSVLVINPATQKSVVVTVNDRCRPRSYPLIDLSRKAAKIIGFFGKGMIRGIAVRLHDGPLPASPQ